MGLKFTTEKLIEKLNRRYNNDSADRLNQYVTPTIFLTFSLIFIFRLYISNPIYCFENAHELGTWNQWINTYCYIESKFFVSEYVRKFPTDPVTRFQHLVLYYQWIPIFLVVLAIMALSPHWLWEALNWKSGIIVRPLVGAIVDPDRRKNKVMRHDKNCDGANPSSAANHFIQLLAHHMASSQRFFGCLPQKGYFATMYALYKAANFLMSIAQLIILNYFFNSSQTFWGYEVVRDLINGINWKLSGTFPRIVYCDFPRREDTTSKVFYSTSQCLLPNSMLHEVMFLLIWFWLVVLVIVNAVSLVKLLYLILIPGNKRDYIWDLLSYKSETEPSIDQRDDEFKKFCSSLGVDGIVALRILVANSGKLPVSVFTYELWSQRKNLYELVQTSKEIEESFAKNY